MTARTLMVETIGDSFKAKVRRRAEHGEEGKPDLDGLVLVYP